ncbi:MAG: zf-HC2 domain-containing protein [Longimicrobiales bacterium]|nr:zf-HC2 domain-containing protein [Longimicrobiales bacterium]
MTCERVRERLPEWAAGALGVEVRDEVASHLEVCATCAEEARTVRLLAGARPAVPGELEVRLRAALDREWAATAAVGGSGVGSDRADRRDRAARPRWARIPGGLPAWVAAAAVLAAVVGRGVLRPGAQDDSPVLAYAEEDAPALLWDEGVVAGAPVLEGLTDEELAQLLEEMEP